MNKVSVATRPIEEGDNPFIDAFGSKTDDEWLQAMVASLEAERVDSLVFPSFPPEEFQGRIHGHGGEHGLLQAFRFYRRVKGACDSHGLGKLKPSHRVLDFGSGWGRIVRFFMRDIDCRNLFGYEPNSHFCRIARACNPYVSFVNGGFAPPTVFEANTFDVVTSWSVFSHLPEHLARKWIEEFARVVRPGGIVIATFWGKRFVDRLREEKKTLDSGGDIHWYSRDVIRAAAGDLDALGRKLNAGEHCFLGSGDYGEAFASRLVVERLIVPHFELVEFNDVDMAQDIAVLRRLT